MTPKEKMQVAKTIAAVFAILLIWGWVLGL
jgi:hypothetical protein